MNAPVVAAFEDSRPRRPVVWSVAGTDSGGGAGLAADVRTAEACEVHLATVVAAVSAQHSRAVHCVTPIDPALLDAQLAALADDMPPAVIKTGLLGGAAQIAVVARWLDRLRAERPVALVVDPVLGASTGAGFVDKAALQAYRELLLPRATVVTPNRSEARRLLSLAPEVIASEAGSSSPRHGQRPYMPVTSKLSAMAENLRALGADSVVITGGDADREAETHAHATASVGGRTGGLALDWLACAEAEGWLAAPRRATLHTHGTGCCFATSLAAALAHGFVVADASVLAKMATLHALDHADLAGHGAGPLRARPGWAGRRALMPWMSFDATPPSASTRPAIDRANAGAYAASSSNVHAHADINADPEAATNDQSRSSTKTERGTDSDFKVPVQSQATPHVPAHATDAGPIGLYAIVDSPRRLAHALEAGVRTLQLRIKAPPDADAAWRRALHRDVREGVRQCRAVGARLFVNDHWALAAAFGAHGVHLGQEDLMALGKGGRRALAASGLALGISSHSLWELARARRLAPAYVACGPVWPTTTKAMPWRPQGLRNLAWWARMAGRPVMAIGGVLDPAQAEAAARHGADGVVLMGALGDDARSTLAPFAAAWARGQAAWTSREAWIGDRSATADGTEAGAAARSGARIGGAVRARPGPVEAARGFRESDGPTPLPRDWPRPSLAGGLYTQSRS